MKRIIYFLLLLIPTTSCLPQSGYSDLSIAQRLDNIVKKYVDSSEFMGSVLIAKNDEILLKKGYGFADIQNKIHNTPSTSFYLASVSKLFTVAAIVQLKNKKLLRLDDSLTKYIPDYPNGNSITIQQLIQHRSGIVDFVNERPYELIKNEIKLNSLIDTFKYLPLNFQPGKKYSYCSSGYNLLAYIIEKVSGMSYSDYIETNIFKPLGMDSSFSDWDSIPITQAKGYHRENGNFLPSDYFHPSQFLGSGNLTSTVEDLYKWYKAIYRTGEISLEYQTDHIGRIGGWTSTNFYTIIASDVVIILLSNYGDAPVVEIAKEIRLMVEQDGDNYQQVSSASIEKYLGYYYSDDKYYMIIEKGDNCLISFANDNINLVNPDTTYKVAEDEFKRSGMRLTFNKKNNNLYNQVLAFWGSNGYKYKRATYTVERPNHYVGSYRLDNDEIIAVSCNNKDLEFSIEKSNGTVLRFPAKGMNEFNFIYPYGRLIFDQLEGDRFQKIKLIGDGKVFTGKKIN
jgi:CubicO group peptidase (beta-lactamase class C family)